MLARLLAPALVLLFVSSLMIGLTDEMNAKEEQVELKEPVILSAPTDPGHTVFAQYITSDNCGYLLPIWKSSTRPSEDFTS